MEFCIVASNYRTETQHVHVFLDNVVVRFVDRGITCHVIAPQSLVRYLFKGNARRKKISHRVTPKGNPYTVYSPVYLVFPPRRLGKLFLGDLTKRSFFQAVKRVYHKKKMKADLVYSHFLHAGTAAVRLGKELGIPSFIANGEADTVSSVQSLSPALVRRTLADVTGIISVSTKNKDEILSLSTDPSVSEKTRVIVNAADSQRFSPQDKAQCRKALGFPEDAFIVSYTGSFIPRKGTRKLSRVLDRFEDVYSVFIGVGEDKPDCKNILHMGRVPNEKIGTYLCASDVFVLPTQAEGCCNAIVEAVSCGVPVISSDRPFNYDVLDDSCAILIDPDSEEELEDAIRRVKEDPALRERLAEGSRRKGAGLSIHRRVDHLLAFMEEQSNHFRK
jgi:glycosyltransferase involved in cell wall biosynthesis